MSDPYADLRQHALSPETLAELTSAPRKSPDSRSFVKVPSIWVERLRGAHYVATYRVALHLLHQHWKSHGRPLTLSNTALEREGVTRRAKWRALRELEALRLIEVERRPRQSPRVVLLA
jgi:hypothetical protein